MSSFDRKEAMKQLPEETKTKIDNYERALRRDIIDAGLQKEEKALTDVLLDFRISYECSEYYRKKYNRQAQKVNKMAREPYVGPSYAEAQRVANEYSKQCMILSNYKAFYEEYDRVATQLSTRADMANKKIDKELRDRGLLDETSMGPSKKTTTPKKR